jgi:hypothetical protein
MADDTLCELEHWRKEIIRMRSPRLANRDQAKDFQLEVVDCDDSWSEEDLMAITVFSLEHIQTRLAADEQE